MNLSEAIRRDFWGDYCIPKEAQVEIVLHCFYGEESTTPFFNIEQGTTAESDMNYVYNPRETPPLSRSVETTECNPPVS